MEHWGHTERDYISVAVTSPAVWLLSISLIMRR
jgi:hypothetical protein